MAYDQNTSLDEAMAKQWVSDVNHEIVLVESLLTEVYNEIQEFIDDEDPVMKEIVKIGNRMQDEWSKMVSEFKNSMDLINSAIDALRKGFEKAVAHVGKVLGNL